MGPEVHELEQELAQFTGASEVVTCSSGTDALLLVLMAWGVGRGDVVILPSFTFAATAETVAVLGATPFFVDVDARSYNIAPEAAIDAISVVRAAKLEPKAVIAVDLYGRPADYASLQASCRNEGVRLLADAAQSFGATYRGAKVGTLGDATATSFFPAKPLGCYGDGGAVFTDDEETARVVRSLRIHGQGPDKYTNERIGLNARLDTLQAAILLQKLKIFPEELDARERIASRYTDALPPEVTCPQIPRDLSSAWAQYTIRVAQRDLIAKELRSAGIPTAIYYPTPLHRLPAYRHASGERALPNSERASREVLSLPMHPYLDNQDQDRIVQVLTEAVATT